MSPFGGLNTNFGDSSNINYQEAVEAIKFLLTLIPGWTQHPDIGLVQPGHTLEYELEIAQRVQLIENKYNPPSPPLPEEIEEDVFG